jgi:hypothetical protein
MNQIRDAKITWFLPAGLGAFSANGSHSASCRAIDLRRVASKRLNSCARCRRKIIPSRIQARFPER